MLQIRSIEQRGRKYYYDQTNDHYPNVFKKLLYHSLCPLRAFHMVIRREPFVCSGTRQVRFCFRTRARDNGGNLGKVVV